MKLSRNVPGQLCFINDKIVFSKGGLHQTIKYF